MTRIAFFGTPDFAVDTLRALNQFCLNNNHTLSLVVCQPDKLAHRGMKNVMPPVKEYALAHQLSIYQPSTLKKGSLDGDNFFSLMQADKSDICIVAAYGKIIPARFLDLPKYGYINVHASLLPRWRGASPIQRAILHGDKETGVCIMRMTPELDAGDVYSEARLAIKDHHTAGELSEDLAQVGGELLVKTLPRILDSTLVPHPQSLEGMCYAPLLTKNDGAINWRQPTSQVLKHILAMQPWPRAFTFFQGKRIFFFDGRPAQEHYANAQPGHILASGRHLTVATEDGAVTFDEVQAEGKKRMQVDQFIKGCNIEIGSSFDGF